jgi:hypothetical protein
MLGCYPLKIGKKRADITDNRVGLRVGKIKLDELSDDVIEEALVAPRQFVEVYFRPAAVLWAFCRIKSPIRVRQRPSTIHPCARQNAFRRRDVRLQSRLFARWNQSLRRSPYSNRPCPPEFADNLRARKWHLLVVLSLPFVMVHSEKLNETIFLIVS